MKNKKNLFGMKTEEYQVYFENNKDKLVQNKYFELLHYPNEETSEDINGIFLNCSVSKKILRNRGFEAYTITDGLPYENFSDVFDFTFEINEDEFKLYDMVANNLKMLIVSSEFKEMYEENNLKGLEFYPLDPIVKGDIHFELYYYAKVINVLPQYVIDFDYALYSYFKTGEVNIVFRALKLNEIIGNDIFLVNENEFHNSDIIFSNKVKKLIEKNNLTGFDYINERIVL